MEAVVWHESPETAEWWTAVVNSSSLEASEADLLDQARTVPPDLVA
ncbi:hypothetical protein [Rhodococcoides trifolii]|nr:hypothetical protein [Rhodococcus trifolii]